MGNCGTKPATNEGEAPPLEQKVEEINVTIGEEEIMVIDEVADHSSAQPPSLGQLILETEGKVKEEAIPTPSEPVKETIIETKEVVAVVESKTEEAETKNPVVEFSDSFDQSKSPSMGNCGTKPATNEGEAPPPKQKAEEINVEDREVAVGEEEIKVIDEVADHSSTQPPSLGQLIPEV